MSDLLSEARAISPRSPAIRAYAVDQATQFLALKAKVDAAPPPPPSSSGREPGVYHINADLGCPTDGSDWSAALQDYLTGSQMLPFGAAIRLAPLSFSAYRWCVEIGDRTDVSWLGHHSGQVGNYRDAAREMVGSWVRPARDGAPVFNCEAANTGQNGPVLEWVKSYHGDWSTYTGSLLRVKNVNNGVVEHCGSMYGKTVVETAPAGSTSDCAWWRCADVRAFECAYGIAYLDGNLGWTIDGGIITRATKGQRGFRLTGYSQNNKLIAYRCDGYWVDSSPDGSTGTIGGSGGLVDGGAHDNHIDIAKIESAIPGIEFQSAQGLEHPTARNVVGGGTVGLRYKQGPAFKVGPRVDWTKVEDDITYVNGPDDDTLLIAVDPLATRTKRPATADLIRG